MNRTSRCVSFLATVAGITCSAITPSSRGEHLVQAIRLMGRLSCSPFSFRNPAWLEGDRLALLYGSGSAPPTVPGFGRSAADGRVSYRLVSGGPILGETLKVWAVSKSIPARFGVTSVVIEDLTYSVGTASFVLTGFLLLLVSTARKHDFGQPRAER